MFARPFPAAFESCGAWRDAAMCVRLEGWLCVCPSSSAQQCPTEERQEVHTLAVPMMLIPPRPRGWCLLAGGGSFSVLSAHLHSSHTELGAVGAAGCESPALPAPCDSLSSFWALLPTDFSARLPAVWGRTWGSSSH